ncbi:DUF2971 domain-containing protein [Ruegeria atlantica]|uniref:DUF2971 domain-containing protein n=1 Tax=Ruegeria atlantica TaxID=81569 RepID=UPI00147E6988|nr:DUF2971 domain-containing protein [Ruegeria atlantica]
MNDIFPNLSSSLFKYGPVKNVARTLQNCTLGFSHLKDFNDIYESEYRFVHFFKSEEDARKLIDPVPDNAMKKARDTIDDQLSKYRVSCFSRRANISLMWSHYADDHKGVCYCFEAQRPEGIFSGTQVGWGGVIYSSELPTVTVFQEHTRVNMLPTIASDVILTKPMEWAYEEEVRFWTSAVGPAVSFDPTKLRAIIVGRRTSDPEIDQIMLEIDEYNQRNNQSVEMWFAHRNAARFTLGICSNRGFRDSAETSISDRIPILPTGGDQAVTS